MPMSRILSIALIALLVSCGRPDASPVTGPAPTAPPTPTAAAQAPEVTPTFSVAIVDVEVGPSVTPTPASALPVIVTPTDTGVVTPTIPLRIGEHALQVELAITPAQQERGLMFRATMPESYGMLFVFP